MFGTPAFACEHRNTAASTAIAVWLKGGPQNAPRYQRELAEFSRRFGANVPFSTVSSRADAESADHAARAVVVGLAIVALVVGLAGIVTIAQAVRRYLARAAGEGRVLAALGSRRLDRAAVQFVAAVPFLLLTPFVAVATAYALVAGVPSRRGADAGALSRATRRLVRVRGRRIRLVPRRRRHHVCSRLARLGQSDTACRRSGSRATAWPRGRASCPPRSAPASRSGPAVAGADRNGRRSRAW